MAAAPPSYQVKLCLTYKSDLQGGLLTRLIFPFVGYLLISALPDLHTRPNQHKHPRRNLDFTAGLVAAVLTLPQSNLHLEKGGWCGAAGFRLTFLCCFLITLCLF